MRTVTSANLRSYWRVYWFVVPSLVLVLTFAYYPALSAVYHSLFSWDGSASMTFTGLANYQRALRDPILGHGILIILILISANLFKMIPSIFTAVVIHRVRSERWSYFYRALFVIPLIIPSMVTVLIWLYIFDPSYGVLNALLEAFHALDLLRSADTMLGLNVFREGVAPGWLAQKELIVPSLILWGFPWVGVVGVLIYLAGLSNIDPDVYDSAKLDGAGSLDLFFFVELPLLMTQVRLNLVLMTIQTLQDYGLVLVILGISGGPGGVGMVPGLYMFRRAFVDQEVGYACAIGVLMFFVILILTWVNNRLVRREK